MSGTPATMALSLSSASKKSVRSVPTSILGRLTLARPASFSGCTPGASRGGPKGRRCALCEFSMEGHYRSDESLPLDRLSRTATTTAHRCGCLAPESGRGRAARVRPLVGAVRSRRDGSVGVNYILDDVLVLGGSGHAAAARELGAEELMTCGCNHCQRPSRMSVQCSAAG